MISTPAQELCLLLDDALMIWQLGTYFRTLAHIGRDFKSALTLVLRTVIALLPKVHDGDSRAR